MVNGSRTPLAVIGCSSISFRHRPFGDALDAIAGCGFREIDLGALPGICDHVPVPLTPEAAASLNEALAGKNLVVRSINADPGPLNDPTLTAEAVVAILAPIVELASALGAAVVVPCGRQDAVPIVSLEADLDQVAHLVTAMSEYCAARKVRLWIEALHSGRFSNSTARANALLDRLDSSTVGLVFDVSHVVAVDEDPVAWLAEVGDRVEHVHLRDARSGYINLSIGRGVVDFAAVISTLEGAGYAGHYSLELETHDIKEQEREEVAIEGFDLVSGWLNAAQLEGKTV